MIEEEIEESEGPKWYQVLFIILFIVGVIVGLSELAVPNQLKSEARKYDRAIKFCGADNVQKHEYTNGTVDFNCEDYSKI